MSNDDLRANALMLAAKAHCDARTAAKALRGERVLPVVRTAVEAAARELNIALPAPASERAA